MTNHYSKTEQVGDSRLGWIFGCSHIGPSHHQEKTPNQDSYNLCSGSFAGYSYLTACVADGHGNKKYKNSHIGSSYAVQDATYVLGKMILEDDFGKNFKADFPKRITKQWDHSVKLHDEKLSPKPVEVEQDKSKLFGTTLISALLYKSNLYLGQIGDGLVVYLDENNNTDKLIPEASETLVGGATDSMSSNGPINLFRTAIRDVSKGGHLFIFTDGLENAFKNEVQVDIWVKDFKKLLDEHGKEKIAKELPAWLKKYSDCSGDDITVAIMQIEPA
jgi:serine/threonine protein phosphatase PrpC